MGIKAARQILSSLTSFIRGSAQDTIDFISVDGNTEISGGLVAPYDDANWSYLSTNPVDIRRFLSTDPRIAGSSDRLDARPPTIELARADLPVEIDDGQSVKISGLTPQAAEFSGSTGTLNIVHSQSYAGQISGLSGADALDLSDIGYSAQTTATFLGTLSSGTLTVSDGVHTANISLIGNYLSSTWTLSSDGNGGTVVVDPIPANTWQTLKVGAGGWLTGIDIASDDTMVVRTDTYGAYIWNGTQWQQVVTSFSMPAANVGIGNNAGVYEIRIAPSNTNILYMEYLGNVYRSDDKGTHWTKTAFAHVTEDPNDNYRMNGQKMAVDPNNANVVYVGTPQNGLFVTADGGATWMSVSAVPVSAKDSGNVYPGITGIAFDPTSGTSNGKTNIIYASSYGHGVYESTNGGVTWSALAGGPSDVEYATVSSTSVYYAVGNANTTLWSYSNGTWRLLHQDTGNGIHTVAVDPFNASRIVISTAGGSLNESLDGGTTWSGQNWGGRLNSTDVPWLSSTGNYMSIGGIVFDQSVANKLYASDGVGVWNTAVPTQMTWSTPITWNSQSAGIEQLVANDIVVAPGGKPILASWDRPFIYVNDPNQYPTSYGPSGFAAGWSLDYASSNPNFIVGLADWFGTEKSGYSNDGGQTWSPFASDLPFSSTGGSIAASTPNEIIWAPAGGKQPYYTKDGGATWKPVALPGVTDWSGFDFAYYLDRRTVTADRVQPDTFYIYYNGVYRSTDGGDTWTKVFSHEISTSSGFNAKIEAVPDEAGNLFFTGGPVGVATHPAGEGFYKSSDGGSTWTAIPNVLEVTCFGFGKSATPGGYPAIFIVGYVNSVYGIWQSDDSANSWRQVGDYPVGSLDSIKTIAGDPNIYGQVYVGFTGSGYAYLPGASGATTNIPIVNSALVLDTGTSPTDNITSNAQLKGTADAGATITISEGGVTLGTTTADGTGAWSFSPSGLADGTHTLAASVTNTSGTGTSSLTFTLDTSAPTMSVALTQDTGGSSSDRITSNATLKGSADAGATVTVKEGGVTLGTTVADGTGAWSFSPSGLANGAHTVTATETDAAGNTGSSSLTFTLDSVAPVVSIALTQDTGSSSSDKITSNAALKGTADAGATVTLKEGGVTLGTTVADGTGAWSFTPAGMGNGVHTVSVSETDVAGNAGSSSLTFTLDTAAPVVSIALAQDTGASSSDKLTSNATLKGNADAGATVTLTEGGVTLGTTAVDGTGAWSFSPSGLANGAHIISVSETDTAGNTGSSSLTFTLDNAAPAVSIALTQDTGSSLTDKVTSNAVLRGTADAGATVTLKEGGTTLGATTADGTGAWSFAPTGLANGAHTISVFEIDAAGNIGSSSLTFTLDTAAPAVSIALNQDTGSSSTDKLTSNAGLKGTADAGATVTLKEGGTTLGATTADGTGAWSFAPTGLANGAHTISVSETDSAGNTGSSSLTFTLDTLPPVVTTVLVQDTGVSSVDNITSNAQLKGTTDANAIVTLKEGAITLGTTNADGTGAWSFSPVGLARGAHTITASATDAAGNFGATSLTFTLDNPVVTLALVQDTGASSTDKITSNGTLTGTADANATVTLKEGNVTLSTATADGFGAWSFSPNGLLSGNHTITASETDTYGNVGTSSLTFQLDTGAPFLTIALAPHTGSSNVSANGRLNGTADANAMVTLSNGSLTLGTVMSDSSGAWSFSPTGLANGTQNVIATETDMAGNVGSASLTFTIDKSAPFASTLWRDGNGALVIWGMNNNAISSGGVTSNGRAVTPDASWSVAGTSTTSDEILWRKTDGTLAEWTMNGSAITSSTCVTANGAMVAPGSSWSVAALADFNGDGKNDILWRNSDGALTEWNMNGATVTSSSGLTAGGNAVNPDRSWRIAGVGDFNGDGKSDILWQNSNGALAEWNMNGSTITSSSSLSFGGKTTSIDWSWSVAAIGDFDGNGTSDVLWRSANGQIAEWLMNGSTIASSGYTTDNGVAVIPGSNWHIAGVSDFNGDGKSDLFWRSDSGALAEWLMNGTQIAQSLTPTAGGLAVSPDNSWTLPAKPTVFG